MHEMTPTASLPAFPDIAPGDLDAARRFLLGESAAPAPPPRRPRADAIAMPAASFGIARARRRAGRAEGAA